MPLLWLVGENDPLAPLDAVRAVVDAWAASEKQLRLLQGTRVLTTADLCAQLEWLVQRLRAQEPTPPDEAVP